MNLFTVWLLYCIVCFIDCIILHLNNSLVIYMGLHFPFKFPSSVLGIFRSLEQNEFVQIPSFLRSKYSETDRNYYENIFRFSMQNKKNGSLAWRNSDIMFHSQILFSQNLNISTSYNNIIIISTRSNNNPLVMEFAPLKPYFVTYHPSYLMSVCSASFLTTLTMLLSYKFAQFNCISSITFFNMKINLKKPNFKIKYTTLNFCLQRKLQKKNSKRMHKTD